MIHSSFSYDSVHYIYVYSVNITVLENEKNNTLRFVDAEVFNKLHVPNYVSVRVNAFVYIRSMVDSTKFTDISNNEVITTETLPTIWI